MMRTATATTLLVLLFLTGGLALATVGAHFTTASVGSGAVRIIRNEPAQAPADIPPAAQRSRRAQVDVKEVDFGAFIAESYVQGDRFSGRKPTRWARWTKVRCRQWLLVSVLVLCSGMLFLWPKPHRKSSLARAAAIAASCLTLVTICLILISLGGSLSARVADSALVLERRHAVEPTTTALEDVRRGTLGHLDVEGKAGTRYDYRRLDLGIASVTTSISPSRWSCEGVPPNTTTTAQGPWRRAIGVECRLWILLPLLAVYPFSVFVYVPFRRRRRNDGLCSTCGYDLTGNETGRCPECGTEVERA